ncbi:MAG: D-glucuronyl C5-epimerase family protein [bacterium]
MIITFYLALASILLTLFIFYFLGEQAYNIIRAIYLKLVGKKIYPRPVYNELMIPKIDYGGDIGIQNNPISVAQDAKKYYELFKDGKIDNKQYFLNCIDWLTNNVSFINGLPFWEYQFEYSKYNMKVPWRSGMAQGRVLQALVLAYKETGNQDYYDFGSKIIEGFSLTIDQKGITRPEGIDMWWYEEYAHPQGVNSKVLNGMIITLMGIWDFYEVSQSAKAKDVFDKGVKAVKASLPLYDKIDGSYYDLVGTISSSWYHQFHIDLLKYLYKITNKQIFKDFAVKWESNPPRKPGFWEKWFSRKSKRSFKIVALAIAIIFSVIFFILLAIHYYFLV